MIYTLVFKYHAVLKKNVGKLRFRLEWWNEEEHYVPLHSLNFLTFMRNMFYFLFFFIPLSVENYRTNLFFINFDKEPSFLIIPEILFLLIIFLSVPIILMMVTSQTYLRL